MPSTKYQDLRFNIVSEEADGAGFGVRLLEEGYDVRMWIRRPEAKRVADNIIPKGGDLEDLISDANTERDVFIFDCSDNGVIADYLMSRGYAVLGGSMLADKLERDRSFGYKVMQECNIDIPETKSFTDFDTAKQFVEENQDARWVYKPSKQLSDLSPSHVSYDAEDLIEMLDNIGKDVEIAEPQFELQAFEKGVAFSTELWFQHGDFITPLTNHTLERKELMNHDIGPSGGCSGNITWFCEGCKVCETAKNLVGWAQRNRYHGMLDLNVIVRERDGGISGLEFTPRFGYDASPTLFWELIRGGLGVFFANAARGRVSSLDLRDGFAGAVRVTIPPYPTSKYFAEESIPIRGIDKSMRDHVFFYDVKKDDSGNLCSSGFLGITCLFTAHSVNPISAFAKPLEAAKSLRLKNKQYRTDLAKCFADDMDKLEELDVDINVYAGEEV